MPAGRPTDYNKEIADRICEEIVMGNSLKRITSCESMPCVATIYSWMRKHPEFLKEYEKAKIEQADALAEDMLDIADDGTNDYAENKDGDEVLHAENIQRSRLRVDTRKWIASRFKPKKYGDRVGVEHSGEVSLISEKLGAARDRVKKAND